MFDKRKFEDDAFKFCEKHYLDNFDEYLEYDYVTLNGGVLSITFFNKDKYFKVSYFIDLEYMDIIIQIDALDNYEEYQIGYIDENYNLIRR